MATVVVVGGGYAGLASAARLAKLGHEVTLLERLSALGGAVSTVRAGGFSWDSGPTYTLLPAVIRDLFAKSGRSVQKEFDLVPLDVVREHRFQDGSVLGLPGHSRAAQLAAFDALGPGLGQQWLDHVDSFADDWEVLRRGYAEVAWQPDDLSPELARRIDGREMLHRRLRRTFRDDRLRLVAAHPFVADGHQPRDVPAWAGLVAYLEQRFGAWQIPGGMGRLTEALATRMVTRRVRVETGVEVRDLAVEGGRVVGVRTTAGSIDADVVVCAVDPRMLPALTPYVARTQPAMPPVVCHVGVSIPLSDHLSDHLPHEVVLHGNPMLVLRSAGTAPVGCAAYTVHGRGLIAEDLLTALARHRIDLRKHLITRVDSSPLDQVELWRASPYGVLWAGRGTVRRRLGPRTPIQGVYAAGAHATPGSGLPFVGLSAALVAQVVGPA